jgi:hypothetical protein
MQRINVQVLTVHVRYRAVGDQASGTIIVRGLVPQEDRVSCSILDVGQEVTKAHLLDRASPPEDGTTSIPFGLQEGAERLSVNVFMGEAVGRSWASFRIMFLAGRLVAVDRVLRTNLYLEEVAQ